MVELNPGNLWCFLAFIDSVYSLFKERNTIRFYESAVFFMLNVLLLGDYGIP